MSTHCWPLALAILSLAAATPTPSVKELNHAFGLPLWTDDTLWNEEPSAVAQRLGCRPESTGTEHTSFLARPGTPVLGTKPETIRLSCRSNKITAILIAYANKGDSVSPKPVRERFKNTAEYNNALLNHEKDLAALARRVSADATTVETALTQLFGAPERLSVGDGGALTEVVKMWRWREHAILLSVTPRESVFVRIVPPDQVRARAKTVSDAELKKELQSRVQRRSNGDVVITEVPMISQGLKGYCVPATWARYLQYAGIAVDEYLLANAGNTRAGGGTVSSQMASAVAPLVARHKRRLISLKGTLSLSLLARYIDDGLPIMWTMRCVGPFRDFGNPPNRMGNRTPEQWSEALKPARTAAHKLPRGNTELHMCMIIGYNKTTKEIATTDSWGPGHEEKWYTLEEAQAVSRDEYYIIAW
ncbi:MAG: C39 family peptidase [Verrucomicrobiae bacterium]|nr:C39 family peptidase [Verrucomicrobiae bacterium]